MWFVYSSEVVSGPFSTEQVREQIQVGRWTSNCFIWWKGQREWMSVDAWETQLGKILKTEEEKSQSPVWYIDINGSPVGPLTQNEMIQHLRAVNSLGKVRLWTVGMNKWTNLFELHDVMDQLGMSRRETERAPLMGSVAINRLSEGARPTIARAASISVAGMGVNDAHGITKGDEVQILIRSPEFPQPIRLAATIVYITPSGYAGMKFSNVHAETHSLIMDYVKKFNKPQEMRKSA